MITTEEVPVHPTIRRTANWIANLSDPIPDEEWFPAAPWRSTPEERMPNVSESLTGVDTLAMAEGVRAMSIDSRMMDLMLRWQEATEEEKLFINMGMLQLYEEERIEEGKRRKRARVPEPFMNWQDYIALPNACPSSYVPPKKKFC